MKKQGMSQNQLDARLKTNRAFIEQQAKKAMEAREKEYQRLREKAEAMAGYMKAQQIAKREYRAWEDIAPTVTCPYCEQGYLEGFNHDCAALPCMWCGELFHPDKVDAHEAVCG